MKVRQVLEVPIEVGIMQEVGDLLAHVHAIDHAQPASRQHLGPLILFQKER